MNRYLAREILFHPYQQLMELPDEDVVEVVFDDGMVQMSTNELIFSQLCWEIQRKYEHAPLLKSFRLSKRVSGMAHAEIAGNCLFETRKHYLKMGLNFTREDVEECSRLVSVITNNIFNFVVHDLGEYVESGCALDFVEILNHPEVAKINNEIQSKPSVTNMDVEECIDKLGKIIINDPALVRNAVSKAVRSGVVKINQALQCVGPRGFVNDIDSQIFPDAIRVGFAQGFTRLADGLKESRSATQSLLYTKGPMQDSEYFNRSEQLAAASIMGIHDSDCGSRNYVPVTIASRNLLADLEGAYYLNEETNQEEYITRDHSHLLGKTIRKRSVLTCKHPNPYEVCARCFGELSISIPRDTNIGYVSAAQLQGPVGQLILSNKHFIGSVGVDEISIDEYSSAYISRGSDENCIYLNPELKGYVNKGYLLEIAFDEKEAVNLTDITAIDNIDMVSPFRISEVRYMEFKAVDKVGNEVLKPALVKVQTDTRVGSLSKDFLRYVKRKGWVVGDKQDYRVDMSEWDFTKPLIQMPLKHFDTVDYMKTIESFIKGTSSKNSRTLTSYETPYGALIALHDIVSLRLSVNVAYLEILLLATLVVDRTNRDYRLPVDRVNGETARYNQIMALHSLAAAYAYEGQADVIFSTEAFLVKVRPRHILDNMVLG